MPPTSSGPTARIAERVVDTRFEGLSTETITVTKQCLMDFIGVALAGMDEPLARILLERGGRAGWPRAGVDVSHRQEGQSQPGSARQRHRRSRP